MADSTFDFLPVVFQFGLMRTASTSWVYWSKLVFCKVPSFSFTTWASPFWIRSSYAVLAFTGVLGFIGLCCFAGFPDFPKNEDRLVWLVGAMTALPVFFGGIAIFGKSVFHGIINSKILLVSKSDLFADLLVAGLYFPFYYAPLLLIFPFRFTSLFLPLEVLLYDYVRPLCDLHDAEVIIGGFLPILGRALAEVCLSFRMSI